jgi:hypothetical protein
VHGQEYKLVDEFRGYLRSISSEFKSRGGSRWLVGRRGCARLRSRRRSHRERGECRAQSYRKHLPSPAHSASMDLSEF